MILRLMRGAARALRAGFAPGTGSVPPAHVSMGRDIEALGARRLTTPWQATEAGVALVPRLPTGAGLVAVGLSVFPTRHAARLCLVGPGGTVHDEVTVAPGTAPSQTWLFAPPAATFEVVVGMAGSARAAEIRAAGAWALPEAALAPEHLAARAELAADPTWSRAYGTVPPGDGPARLRERVFSGLREKVLIETLGDLRLWLEPGDELSRAVFLTGLYEPAMLLAMGALLPTGGIFVDVGAHCGLVAAYGAQRVGPQGHVIAFEPSPREFARLEANIAASGLAQVETRRMAVADAPGTLTLRLAEAGHAGHNTVGERFAYEGVVVADLVTVEAVTLDAALAGLERCDLIKMDIEGAELRALRGAAATLARLRPALILEVFDRSLAGCGDTEEAVFAWLAGAGYDAREIDLATGRFEAPARVQPGESRNIVALPRG